MAITKNQVRLTQNDANHIRGGHHQYATYAEMLAIDPTLLMQGMLCTVYGDPDVAKNHTYELTNAAGPTWSLFSSTSLQHALTHITGGNDQIPVVTSTSTGLMSPDMLLSLQNAGGLAYVTYAEATTASQAAKLTPGRWYYITGGSNFTAAYPAVVMATTTRVFAPSGFTVTPTYPAFWASIDYLFVGDLAYAYSDLNGNSLRYGLTESLGYNPVQVFMNKVNSGTGMTNVTANSSYSNMDAVATISPASPVINLTTYEQVDAGLIYVQATAPVTVSSISQAGNIGRRKTRFMVNGPSVTFTPNATVRLEGGVPVTLATGEWIEFSYNNSVYTQENIGTY